MTIEREAMDFDVVIVGAGPSGLATAIRLAQLAKEQQQALDICVLEKGAEVGAHTLSGAVIEPRALNELLPDWQEQPNFPKHTPVQTDQFLFLTEQKSWKLPTPGPLHNQGNFIVSLGQVCRWLGEVAEGLGVQIYPGFSAKELLIENHAVKGVITGDMGIGKSGQPKDSFQPGMILRGKYTVFAEGCRGHLAGQLMETFDLRAKCAPQTYGLGIKELWEVPSASHQPGTVIHTVGWPLQNDTYGGSFIYHLEPNYIAIGFVVGLDYSNPYLSPYQEFQRFKHHPAIRPMLEQGQRIEYGARTINEGGIQSIPGLVFPGGLLVGCSAGFLNVPKIKGSHTAMKSGMIAAECLFKALMQDKVSLTLDEYPQALKKSWVWSELQQVRNIRPAFRYGFWKGMAYSALDHYILRGKAPWTFTHHADHQQLLPVEKAKPIDYPKPDNKISFDRLTSVALSNTYHEEDQPVHLQLKDPTVPIAYNLKTFDAPEQRYCPAGVYEIVRPDNESPYLQINAQNCVHCKACDIKDPTQNIQWVTPEGGGGPNYSNM